MTHQELELDLVNRFGITNTEARAMIRQQEAKAAIKKSVALASRGGVVEAAKKGEVDFEQPQQWRHEVHKRLAAIEVMEEGVGCLRSLQKHIKAVIEAEEQLIQKKRAKVRDKQTEWWDLRDSGWAMGGRERFATYVGDIFKNLDEGALGGKVADRMGFRRSIPLPDIPEPVVEPEPRNADELVAALVNGARMASEVTLQKAAVEGVREKLRKVVAKYSKYAGDDDRSSLQVDESEIAALRIGIQFAGGQVPGDWSKSQKKQERIVAKLKKEADAALWPFLEANGLSILRYIDDRYVDGTTYGLYGITNASRLTVARTARTLMNKTQEKEVIRVLCRAGKETLAKTFARSRGYRVKRVKAQTFDPRKAVVYFDLIQDEDAEGGDEMAALKELQKMLKVRKIGNEGHDSYGALTCKIDVQSTKDVKNLYKLIDRAKGGGDDIIFVDDFMAQQFRLLPEGVNGPQIETDDIDDFLEDVG